jgi:HTH-type transcriptional regulator / antitoxin HigA
MENQAKHKFDPDYAVHPGRILDGILEARGMSKKDFAERSGLSTKQISLILHGKAPITPQTSIQFERVLGMSADTWDNLERNYQKRLARLAERKTFAQQLTWLERFPLKALAKIGIIRQATPEPETVENLLNFFGVGSIPAYEKRLGELIVNFRRSEAFGSNPDSVAVWLRLCELSVEGTTTEPYDKGRFIEALKSIRALTAWEPGDFVPEVQLLCHQSGVALAIVGELPGTRLSGATRWLTKDRALIMLSLRHKSDDHFWFSFFHEAAHILLHQKTRVFLDELDPESEPSLQEDEANKYAQDALIPSRVYKVFVGKGRFDEETISALARQIGISQGIVVGRLQHDKRIPPSWHNGLKRRFELKENRLIVKTSRG